MQWLPYYKNSWSSSKSNVPCPLPRCLFFNTLLFNSPRYNHIFKILGHLVFVSICLSTHLLGLLFSVHFSFSLHFSLFDFNAISYLFCSKFLYQSISLWPPPTLIIFLSRLFILTFSLLLMFWFSSASFSSNLFPLLFKWKKK